MAAGSSLVASQTWVTGARARSPTTMCLASGRDARALATRASLRACRVTSCPPSTRLRPAIRPRPSVDPVISTRATGTTLAHAGLTPTAGWCTKAHGRSHVGGCLGQLCLDDLQRRPDVLDRV